MGIHKISDDVLRDILDLVVADPEKFINIDRRAHLFYLSVESFKQPPPPSSVGDYRWVCKRFAELLLPHQFTRITTRFSQAGFERLDNISKSPHLAKYTRKFSYMIPLLYVEAQDEIRKLSRSGHFSQQDIDQLTPKAEEQRRLVRSKEDVASLRRAMRAFISLQHVHIFRLETNLDRAVLRWADRNHETASLKWTPAWSHAVRTMGEALLLAESPFSRFSGQWLNPQSALELSRSPTHTISFLAERLTCLELHFDAGQNENMRELSGLFKTVFTAARNMQAIHLGFPSHLELGLEEIFHDVRWDKLRAFGIQAWRLDADEIINIARRHRKTLRGLRLRDVLLKEGSMWKDVIAMLHDEMEVLEWVSLRRIGYARQYDPGFEITDEDLVSDSENDNEGGLPGPISEGDEGDHEEPNEGYDVEHDEGVAEEYHEEADEEDSIGDDDSLEDQDDDHGPGANELALSPDTPASAPWSYSSFESHPMTVDELEDNGIDVIWERRKKWEQWILAKPRDQVHSHPA